MFNSSYYFGMNFIWWFIWIILLIWIFATPYNIPGQRRKKDLPIDILNRRFASGEITKDEYEEKRRIIETQLAKISWWALFDYDITNKMLLHLK